jgi:drug/metabolite transporter (DMT)-like permease
MLVRHWVCLALAFAGNAIVFAELQSARIQFTLAAIVAFAAGLLFTVLPICSARLHQRGLGTWAVLKSQGAVAGVLAIPALGLLMVFHPIGFGGPDHGAIVIRSLEVGSVNAIAFTLAPFYLWYRGIARCGIARTSICAFAEPLVATLFSLFVLHDAPPTPMLLAGVALVLVAIAASVRSHE